MVHKMDMKDFAGRLNRVASDYLAMAYLLDNSHPEGDHWRRHMTGARKAVARRIPSLSDEFRGKPESVSFDGVLTICGDFLDSLTITNLPKR